MAQGLQGELDRDIRAATDARHPVRRMLRRVRAWMERRPRIRWAYRLVVGMLGGALTALGLLLVPLPGPGWLVVFLGLAVLGTEFAAARRVSAVLRRLLARFWAWWRARRARAATE